MAGKYFNRKVPLDGYVFDSILESKRYIELLDMLRNGSITNLSIHPKYELKIGKTKICDMFPDFSYIDTQTHGLVVEDVKSRATITAVFRLKCKLMWSLLGIKVIIVGLPPRKKRITKGTK